jgi:hypothetical protein
MKKLILAVGLIMVFLINTYSQSVDSAKTVGKKVAVQKQEQTAGLTSQTKIDTQIVQLKKQRSAEKRLGIRCIAVGTGLIGGGAIMATIAIVTLPNNGQNTGQPPSGNIVLAYIAGATAGIGFVTLLISPIGFVQAHKITKKIKTLEGQKTLLLSYTIDPIIGPKYGNAGQAPGITAALNFHLNF